MSSDKTPQNMSKKSHLAEAEENVLQFWRDNDIFEKTLEQTKDGEEFVFYEGPPTANGRPGIHHVEARAFKDIIPRFKTMQGYHVRRKGGWDTHGLPVELEVEKQLELKSKQDIEEYGIAAFNKKCRESVWKYVDEWKEFTERMGYWIDLKDPYITYEADYIESLWFILKTVSQKGLLYKDYKVVPWCPRCGTVLSSHELAQGYQEVKDLSVYVKFKLEGKDEYILAWTTTPWTVPGNVALAVSLDIEYVKINSQGDKLWLAKNRLPDVAPEAEILEEKRGEELVGEQYEPLYPYLKETLPTTEENKLKNAFKIYPADFVTTEDGTGVVHTAVMYGADDFQLGTKYDLPKHHLVGEDGVFMKGTDFLEGAFVKDEDTSVALIKDLAHRNLLFKKEKITHTYPFCWRCKTALIYYARSSWYIEMSKLRDELIENNKAIHWEPEYIKEGRFGEWIKEVKDWAISRERYWGTPLPVWVSEDESEQEVLGSLAELKEKTKSSNRFFALRHGEADNNVENVLSSKPLHPHHITSKGKEEVKEAAQKLKKEGVDMIISSDFVRTKESAELLQSELGLSSDALVLDERIRELDFGDLHLQSLDKYHELYNTNEEKFEKRIPGGENHNDVKRRVGDFLYEVDKTYTNKTIVIVSHSSTLWMLFAAANACHPHQCVGMLEDKDPFIENAEVRELNFAPVPHNEHYELDFHRPYIDNVEFLSESGTKMTRVPEVMDVWFDSGGMPFAEDHYPFENKRWIEEEGYPADYIAEAIDQTRGWFYTLHAIGALVDKGPAYKNVVCLGHILDKNGQKMSKSKGNTVNPWEMMDAYGVDTLRYWMYSINQPGEPKNFDEKTVDEAVKKVFNLLFNVVKFYEMYAASLTEDRQQKASSNVLDQWILARLHNLISDTEKDLNNYKILEPAREIRAFIADLSQWYIRRSRDRFKSRDKEDKQAALNTTQYVLKELSKLMAPFMPFTAENVWQRVKTPKDRESVHLSSWPEEQQIDEALLDDMKEVREFVSLGLEERAKAGIKVRQPLQTLSIKSQKLKENQELQELIKDEVNLKEVICDDSLEQEVELDINITAELKEEGNVRELIRALQSLRKRKGLNPEDDIQVNVSTDKKGQALISSHEHDIALPARVSSFEFKDNSKEEVVIDDMKFYFEVIKRGEDL